MGFVGHEALANLSAGAREGHDLFCIALKTERSDFVLEGAYDALLQSTTARLSLLQKLPVFPPPGPMRLN